MAKKINKKLSKKTTKKINKKPSKKSVKKLNIDLNENLSGKVVDSSGNVEFKGTFQEAVGFIKNKKDKKLDNSINELDINLNNVNTIDDLLKYAAGNDLETLKNLEVKILKTVKDIWEAKYKLDTSSKELERLEKEYIIVLNNEKFDNLSEKEKRNKLANIFGQYFESNDVPVVNSNTKPKRKVETKQETIPVNSYGQTSFLLSKIPEQDDTVVMRVNGHRQIYGIDYTVSGSTITWKDNFALYTDDIVEFWYLTKF